MAESNDDALLSLEDELEAAQAQLKKMGEQVAALTRQLSQCKGAGIQAKLDKCNRKVGACWGPCCVPAWGSGKGRLIKAPGQFRR